MNSRATQLKFECPRMAHYTSHYHYGSQPIDLTNYSFLPNSLVSMLTHFSVTSTDGNYIPMFFWTKLFLVDVRPSNKVVISSTAYIT